MCFCNKMRKLTQLDKKLIFNLDFEARQSLTKLAKRLNSSKQVVKYRIEKLQRENIILGFYTDINSSKLGYAIYLVYFKFQNLGVEKEKELITHFSKQNSVGVNVSINGNWDYCIGIWAESIIHFKIRYREIMKHYEKYVKSKTIMIETDFYYFKPKMILDQRKKKSEPEIKMSGDIEKYQLDSVDKVILSELSKNSRLSLIDISKKTNLSANAIKLRIKKLEKEKVILGYRLMLNYPLLNFLHYRVFLHLENITESKEKSIIQFLKMTNETISVTKTVGYCDLEFRVIVKNVHEMYTLMEGLRKQFPDIIKDYDTILYYKFHDTLNYFPFK